MIRKVHLFMVLLLIGSLAVPPAAAQPLPHFAMTTSLDLMGPAEPIQRGDDVRLHGEVIITCHFAPLGGYSPDQLLDPVAHVRFNLDSSVSWLDLPYVPSQTVFFSHQDCLQGTSWHLTVPITLRVGEEAPAFAKASVNLHAETRDHHGATASTVVQAGYDGELIARDRAQLVEIGAGERAAVEIEVINHANGPTRVFAEAEHAGLTIVRPGPVTVPGFDGAERVALEIEATHLLPGAVVLLPVEFTGNSADDTTYNARSDLAYVVVHVVDSPGSDPAQELPGPSVGILGLVGAIGLALRRRLDL